MVSSVCPSCGCEQIAGAQFCSRCGARQADPVQSVPAQQSGPTQQQQAPSGGYPLNPGYAPNAGYAPSPAGPAYADFAMAKSNEQRLRLRQNLQPLGICWIMFGVYRVITGLIGALVLHHLVRSGMFSDAPAFLPSLLGSVVPAIATLSAVLGLGSIIAGYALLSRQPWGRILALILGVLALIKLPFGTALGIYTLWVLAPGAAQSEWEAISQA